IEDVLEQIVGEIEDEHDIDSDEDDIVAMGSGIFSVRALTPVDDFNEHFDSHFSDEEFVTIGGVVMNSFGRMPKEGDKIELERLQFTITAANTRRIYQIQVEKVESPQQELPLSNE
ncbi:MAG: magnesium/cobalt efflux protein, partial [Chromatiales bacterium]|nr:magnesium/cobalt efflux protein [Chromatiales bacterium]